MDKKSGIEAENRQISAFQKKITSQNQGKSGPNTVDETVPPKQGLQRVTRDEERVTS